MIWALAPVVCSQRRSLTIRANKRGEASTQHRGYKVQMKAAADKSCDAGSQAHTGKHQREPHQPFPTSQCGHAEYRESDSHAGFSNIKLVVVEVQLFVLLFVSLRLVLDLFLFSRIAFDLLPVKRDLLLK